MAKDRRNEPGGSYGSGRQGGEGRRDMPLWSETQIRAIALVDEIIQQTPSDDSRLSYLMLLRHQLEVDEQQASEAQELIAKYDEAYTKLTGSGHTLDFKSINFTLDPVRLETPQDEAEGSTQFENFYISNKHLLFFASLAIRHPPHDPFMTEVQIISLARTEPGAGDGDSALPLTR